jgi:hypothetical protein
MATKDELSAAVMQADTDFSYKTVEAIMPRPLSDTMMLNALAAGALLQQAVGGGSSVIQDLLRGFRGLPLVKTICALAAKLGKLSATDKPTRKCNVKVKPHWRSEARIAVQSAGLSEEPALDARCLDCNTKPNVLREWTWICTRPAKQYWFAH